MKYYPINLKIENMPCTVVGGGDVGTRKVSMLLECGAVVTVISPKCTDVLHSLSNAGKITLIQRNYAGYDVENAFLVIGATDNQALNRQIYADCHQYKTLCNIADCPELCDFILPSIIRRGDLIVAISTSGKSPAFAKHLRRELEDRFGPEYGIFLTLMGAIRTRLLSKAHQPEAHKGLFETLISQGLLDMIRKNDRLAINRLLAEILGDGFVFEELIGG
ncbi:MAG: bifunctional precorrin-2 dehydrogenase/sirohydrochlorin ferrochelatase [Desulfatirhabdiaceae bacterium]